MSHMGEPARSLSAPPAVVGCWYRSWVTPPAGLANQSQVSQGIFLGSSRSVISVILEHRLFRKGGSPARVKAVYGGLAVSRMLPAGLPCNSGQDGSRYISST